MEKEPATAAEAVPDEDDYDKELYAGVDMGDRMTHKNAFNDKNSDMRVLFVTTGAGGAGLNLQVADYVLFVNDDWNDANIEQAERRVNRPERIKPTEIYTFKTPNTLEDHVQGRREVKREKWQRVRDGHYFVLDEDETDGAVLQQIFGW